MKENTNKKQIENHFWQKHRIIFFSIITACLVTSFIILYLNHSTINKSLKPEDLTISKDDENTIITNPTKSIDAYTDNENLYIIAGKLKQTSHFTSVVKGNVTALGGVYTQTVRNDKIKIDNEFYIQTKSTSSFVSVGKQTYIANENIVMRDATNVSKDAWSNNFKQCTAEEYKQTYGVLPNALSNYALNDETIIDATKTKNEDGTITFTFKIDTEKGTKGYRINMYKLGGLSSLPKFNACTLKITVDANWQIKTIKSIDEYVINKGGLLSNLNCSSTLTETFEYPNKATMQIPNKNLFTNVLNSH